ncbi:hypothetical protein LguiA_024264 [Lonicera macranthoides]
MFSSTFFCTRLIIVITTIGLCLFPTARSHFNPIRLPSSSYFVVDDDGDLCSTTLSPPVSCPVNCFRTDPVCGVDGVTYWCGCPDALCSGTRVAKLGFCEVERNRGSGQAFLLVNIVWLILLGISLLFGLL